MVLHQCSKCKKLRVNRIAADDEPEAILEVFENSKNLKLNGIKTLTQEDEKDLRLQILGKE
jgi:hypothetical protein